MATSWFLGRCLYEPRPYTRIEPLAFAQDGSWLSWDKWSETFPREGRIFSPKHPGVGAGLPFAFDAYQVADPSGPDEFQLGVVQKVEEVLDYTDRSIEDARRELVEKGVVRAGGHKEQVVVALTGGRCVRITLVPNPFKEKSFADLGGLEKLQTFAFDTVLFDGIKVEGKWYAVPQITVGQPGDVIDWSVDKDFLDTLIKRLKRVGKPEDGTVPFPATKAQVQAILTTLDRFELFPSQQSGWRAANDRVKRLSADLRIGVEKVDQIVAILSELSPVDEKLRVEIEARREGIEKELRTRIEEELRREIEAAHSTLMETNRSLLAEIETLAAKRELIVEEIAQRTTEKDDIVSALERMISDLALVSSDRETPGEPMRRLASDLQHVLADRGDLIAGSDEIPMPLMRPARFDRNIAPKPWSEIGAALSTAATFHGFDASDLRVIDILARSGETVLLGSNVAMSLVRCYASAVAQGLFSVQSLDTSVLGHEDIWRMPATGSLTTFSRVWKTACFDRSTLRIVLLEGIERTPMDMWILSFMSLLASPERPANLLVFMSMGGRPIDSGRDMMGLEDIVVPIRPAKTPGLTGEQLRRVLGDAADRPWFDDAVRPRPTKDDFPSLVQSCLEWKIDEDIDFPLRAHVAGWPFRGPETDELVRTVWASRLGKNAGTTPPKMFADGRDWLKSMID